MSSMLLANGLIKIWQRRISALSARTCVVIPSLHWEDRGGLGVNTWRGLSLPFCAGEKKQRSLHNAPLRREPPAQQLSFHRVRGVTLFPPGKLFFSSYTMDALWPLNENRSFQCAFLWVSVLTEGQWIRNQHLYKTLFLAHIPPPPS